MFGLEKELLRERSSWLRVKNPSRTSILRPAEALLTEWKWEEKICKCVIAFFPCCCSTLKNQKAPVQIRKLVSIISPEKLAHEILDTLTSFCSLGQLYVIRSAFEFELAEPSLRRLHQTALEHVGVDMDENVKTLVSRFIPAPSYHLGTTNSIQTNIYLGRNWSENGGWNVHRNSSWTHSSVHRFPISLVAYGKCLQRLFLAVI